MPTDPTNASAPTSIIVQAAPESRELAERSFLQQEIAHRDESASVKVMIHRYKGELNTARDQVNAEIAELQRTASEHDQALTKAGEAHLPQIDVTALRDARDALMAAELGTFDVVIEPDAREDRLRQFVFKARLTSGTVNADGEFAPASYNGTVGKEIEIAVPFAAVDGAEEAFVRLAATNAKLDDAQERATEIKKRLIELPERQESMEVALAERQLSQSESGRDVLATLEAKFAPKIDHLLPPGKK